MTIDDFLNLLGEDVRPSGNGWTALCPAHEDRNPSLSVSLGADGKILLKCFSGCTTEAVCAALGIGVRDLFSDNGHAVPAAHAPARPGGNGKRIEAVYDYADENGTLLYQAVRFHPKDFRQRRPDRENPGKWIWSLKGVKRVLFRLNHIARTKPGETIYLVEGEKDVLNLANLGFIRATCNAGGAGKWDEAYNDYFRGHDVVILPDNDEPGRQHARLVAGQILPLAKSVKVVELPGLPYRGDATDWIEAGGTKKALRELCKNAPIWTPPPVGIVQPGGSGAGNSEASWPDPLAQQAFHGLAGDFVRTIEPHTEADPAALLFSFLGAFGNTIGNGPHCIAEADKHPGRLFVGLVGETAKGRKGSSWGHIQRAFEAVDPVWAGNISGGLSSGEGLIWNVRDPIEKQEPIRDKKLITGYQMVQTDPGVLDKRLFLIESELASVLRRLQQEGNTLSAIVRMAWDHGNLNTLVKNDPARATGAHVSLLGHVTADELLRYLDRTELANGFANRFLWVCVRRSKCLPLGGNLRAIDLDPVIDGIREAACFARGIDSPIRMDPVAESIWIEVYPALSEGAPGLFGAVTGRAEAQVIRLALVYAMLDQSRQIGQEHLMAALALWDYCLASVRYIFGDSRGGLEDEILKALANGPMTRTDLYNHFGRNKRSAEIGGGLSALMAQGAVRVKTDKDTGGRPVEIYSLIGGTH